MNRAEAVRLAKDHARLKPESYVTNDFKPHAWVIYAILDAAERSQSQLVEFFRSPEGARLGQEGDDALRTPTQQAIHSMRELLKIRAGIERTRKRGKVQPPVLEKCYEGHDYYRVGDTVPTRCPICLSIELDKLRTALANARQKVGAAWADLK